jgi:hypothetical protein
MANGRRIIKVSFPLPQWKKQWTAIVVIVAGLRIFYGAIGFWVVSSGGPIPLQETIYGVVKPYLKNDVFSAYIVNPWFGWDTISYLKIAILGYGSDATIAFMPLYPFLIRLFAPLLAGNYLLSALVISTICAAVTLILMYELLRKYYPDEIAWRAVLFFIVFPTFFFLLAGYTESLFLVFVLASWILAWKRHWLWAGIFSGLATLTRLQGVILSAVLLWMMIMSRVERPAKDPFLQVRQALEVLKSLPRQRINIPGMFSWFSILIPPLIALLYQAWLKSAGFGTISGALRTYWKLETVTPWTGFLLFLQRLPTRHFNYMDWIDLTLLILVLVAAIHGLCRLDPAFSIYVWLTLAVLFTRGTPPHLLASYSRYFLGLFPLFLLPALNPNRYQRLAVMCLFFFFQVVLVSIFLWGSWVA